MVTKNKIAILFFILSIGCMGIFETGCKKYLDAKSNKALAVPESLQDLQALMDYYLRINNVDPVTGIESVDDFYLTETDYNALYSDADRRIYTWGISHLFDSYSNDWAYQYDIINMANIVLDNIAKIQRTTDNASQWDNVKGQALLQRARSFQLIAWLWANAYDKNNATSDLGIPLRLHSDFNIPTVRSSLEETYKRILTDLKESVSLLPVIPVHVIRPSRPAAYALLARTYLSMRDYMNAGNYSDSCLQLFSGILDFNSLNAGASYPITRFNNEVIMDNRIPVPDMYIGTRAKIDSLLYQSYANGDLRKVVFFKDNNGFFTFKGSYEGASAMFSGIATDEVILMRAECLARAGSTSAAMDDLNSLLVKRWRNNAFIRLTATDANDALGKILNERRKELLMRGLRWMDIKRLNKEGAGIVMKRYINGQTYTLQPNALRYTFPIPETVIDLTGIQQNPF